MRINLTTPFSDKDAAKALGAKWDGKRKVWYIVDVADLAPFMRWIPDLAAAVDDAPAGKVPSTGSARGPSHARPEVPAVTKPPVNVPHCGCAVLPWEHCIHTQA